MLFVRDVMPLIKSLSNSGKIKKRRTRNLNQEAGPSLE
jgi:hypothetical protein